MCAYAKNPSAPLAITDNEGVIQIKGSEFEAEFDKKAGYFTSLVYNGNEMIYNNQGFTFNWYRSCNNDRRKYQETTVDVQDCHAQQQEGAYVITVKAVATVANEKNATYPYEVVYSVSPCGKVAVKASFTLKDDAYKVPRLGLVTSLTDKLENVTYYGRGRGKTIPIERLLLSWAFTRIQLPALKKNMSVRKAWEIVKMSVG